MITPENQSEEYHSEEENKKTVYKETSTDDSDELSNGETSSPTESGRTAFAHTPDRKSKPLGSSHEPGTSPGRDF